MLVFANTVLLDVVILLLLESLWGAQMGNLLEYGFVYMLSMGSDLVHWMELYSLSLIDIKLV